MTYTIARNTQYSSTEIYFDGKPAAQIREAMKAKGMRWHGVKACWYGKVSEEEARAILEGAAEEKKEEKAEAAPEFYTVATEGYMGATEYTGNHVRDFDGTSECFKKAFKAAGVKGVTVRRRTYSGGMSFSFTVKMKDTDFRSLEEYAEGNQVRGYWLEYRNDGGKVECIHRDNFWALPGDEADTLRARIFAYSYERLTRDGAECTNTATEDGFFGRTVFSPSGAARLDYIKQIIGSFNHDDTNSQVDYFDTNFYHYIYIKR